MAAIRPCCTPISTVGCSGPALASLALRRMKSKAIGVTVPLVCDIAHDHRVDRRWCVASGWDRAPRERPPEELPSASPVRSALSRAKASVPRAGVVTCDVVNVGRCWRRFLLTGGRGKEGWRASGDCVTCCEEHVQTPQDSDLNPGMWTRGHRSRPSILENTAIDERSMREVCLCVPR
jgi:hypothetical protein